MEKAQEIEPGFDIADGEDVSISTSEDGLTMRFRDWKENNHTVLFAGAIAHRWEPMDYEFIEGERFDSSHIIINSKWLERHTARDRNSPLKHYRLNFNAEGTLEVLAESVVLQIKE